jgi:hypothetical protein
MDYTIIDNFIYEYLGDPAILFSIIAVLLMILITLIVMLIRSFKKKNQKIEPIVIEKVKNNDLIDIESLVEKMQENLEDKEIAVFENDQEEKAIISLSELMATVKEEEIKNENKFQNTQFISPIYGVEKEEIDSTQKHEEKPQVEIEKPVSNPIKIAENEKFLIALKEFRRNLE